MFPIGFDLEAAVNDTIKKWNSGQADRLEKALQKRALEIKLKLNTKSLDNLDDVKKRLAQLKIEPITPETRIAIKELAIELKQLAKALEQVQKYSKTTQLGQQNFRNDVQMEKLRQANERLEIQKRRVALAEQKHADAMQRSAERSKQLGNEYQKQSSYLNNLLKKTAALWSLHQVSAFLTNIRQVTAEFELQKVSLGAIIQDQQRANQLFAEIKSFALTSPLKILDLTKYTKQVAAYGFETEKLFDTTKMLADISVGLGVDMSRLTLFLGQVFATGYLRASEVRQATEAGIPLVDKLAQKLTEANGKLVTAADVMDLISKRAISFEQVEEVFKDMTSAGGEFYNMQEKQSQTLYGMWSKLGDAAAIMYSEMGNTAGVNSGMKNLITLIQDMMLHWTALANVIQVGVIGFGAYKAAMAGLVSFYKLSRIQVMANIKAEKASQALLLKRTSLYAKLMTEQLRQLASTKKLTTAEWEEYITKNKLNQISALRLARLSKEDAALKKALINQKLYTASQIQQIQAMSKGQYIWANAKSAVLGLGGAFKSLGAAIKTFWPLALITAALDLFMDWQQAVAAQEEAVKKVDKQYEEMKVSLMEIENAYRDIQNASKSAGESEEEFAKTSYSQKLEQLQKVIKLLDNFGMKNVIDPSVLNYTNIDPVLDSWLAKLNEANELSRGWGREVALVANAYEGNIFGWSIFGENLKEDMKDLERSWTKLTVNSEFNDALSKMRAEVGKLATTNKDVYNTISKAVGIDAKLALAQKRRNESELEYQQRIYKNFIAIGQEMGHSLFGTDWAAMANIFEGTVVKDFQKDVDEVMHEFDKVKEKFRDQDALTVKMAIDTVAAENDWTDWQKELLIQHLNENPITLNAELIPTGNIAGQGAVAEGLKAIITSEFPTLFNENELQSLVSAEGIVEAIKAKLDASNESLEKTIQLQNNLAYGSKGFEKSLERIKKLQQEISDIENMRAELQELEAIEGEKTDEQLLRQSELQAKLQEIDEQSINTKRAQIAAIVEANAKYDEQIKKQRESAEAEREIAKAALDRVTSMGLSDLGKDVKEQFAGLRVDAVKAITDNNYSTDFLISDEELQKIRDVGDIYDMWAKNTKAIKDEKEKLVGVGITEATIAKERAELEAKRAQIQLQLKEVETAIADEKFKGQEAQYASLKLALANATTADAQKTAQENLNKFLGDTKNAEFAILMMKKEGLKTTLQETLVSQAANTQIEEYLKGLDNAEELWKKLGERYNFKLQEKGKKGGGSGEDPWILLMKNRMKFMQDFQKGVENLSKWMGNTKALADEQENMLGRGLSLKIDARELNGTKEELIKWYEDSIGEIRKKIAKLGGKEWEGLGVQMILAKDTKSRVLKKYQELLADMFKELTDFRTEQTQKDIEAQIKELSDRISRTKTAREFYDKVLNLTGDNRLASKVAESIFGQNGSELRKALADQVRGMTGDIPLPDGIISADNIIDYKALRGFAEANKTELGNMYDELVKISDNGQRDLAKTYEGYLKDLEKAKSYSDKRIELARYTANKIAEINASTMPQEEKERLTAGYQERETQKRGEIEWEAFKDMPIYVQMFDDLDNASTIVLSNMKDKLLELQSVWGASLNPTQLKELQSRLNEIDAQLVKKNPFKALSDAMKEYRSLSKTGTQADAERGLTEATDRQIAAQQKLNIALNVSRTAQDKYNDAVSEYGADSEQAKNAKMLWDAAEQGVDDASKLVEQTGLSAKEAQRLVEAWKKVKDAIGLSLGEVFQIAHSLGDLAGGIGKLTEVFGGSEEDVQYWNDIASGLNEVTSGIENMVQASISGNPIGIVTSAITAIPNMISGFSNLFSAGKVKRANKEIKKQQNLLEQLEYTYERLEHSSDKLFGRDYIDNYNKRLENLQMQAVSYQKMYEAEKSKGKKKDKQKLKEYEKAYQDTMDEIADMQNDLVAKFTGSTRSDIARQMAQSWIDARASMSDTFAAIKSDYQDLIKNMIVEGAAARVVENALSPMWDKMDKMLADNDIDGAIDALVGGMDSALNAANNGMETLWQALEAKGYDMKKLLSDTDTSEYTGIAKSVSSATSEEINANTAALNTQNYYISHIDENVAAMYMLMRAGMGGETQVTTSAGWTDWQQQAMDSYLAIQRNTADTVVECRRAANACEEAVNKMSRVIKVKGATQGFNVFLNS